MNILSDEDRATLVRSIVGWDSEAKADDVVAASVHASFWRGGIYGLRATIRLIFGDEVADTLIAEADRLIAATAS